MPVKKVIFLNAAKADLMELRSYPVKNSTGKPGRRVTARLSKGRIPGMSTPI